MVERITEVSDGPLDGQAGGQTGGRNRCNPIDEQKAGVWWRVVGKRLFVVCTLIFFSSVAGGRTGGRMDGQTDGR